ncbi:DUF3343 domain-containing protein [Hathewaya histolytica]|uniref:Protein of uncharacterized function (DUF3343) n=1 Tax=Hathewaya histolytica TaxID=1498 RepID=A0A4U9RZJ8_HATHI|nr:DUF3343 domain-containing protein [Hathewaya histolytica]VTQ96563.1 Protein of uncharacterised function (DUF3343) [Hathewaya histolytica]
MEKRYVVTFKNTHTAIKGESVAKNNGIKLMVIPTPTFITKSCGISLKFSEQYLEKFQSLNGEIEYDSIYEENGTEYKKL